MRPESESSADLPPRRRVNPRDLGARERYFLIGAVLALALFLVEAGVAEILIGSDTACRLALSRQRLPPDPFTVCHPEWVWFMLRSVARGWAWLFNTNTSLPLAWISMGGYYALAGGISAQLDRRNSILLLIMIQIATIAIVAGLGYIRQFIA